MTYSESADEITISHERALQELDRHGVLDEAEEFHRDCGQLLALRTVIELYAEG